MLRVNPAAGEERKRARERASIAAFRRQVAARAKAVVDTTTTIEAQKAPANAAQAPGSAGQSPGGIYQGQLRALRALDRNEPGNGTRDKRYRQARHHPYNVKQTPEEYAAPWGWRHGKAVRAKASAAERLAPTGLFLSPPLHPPHTPAPAPAPILLPPLHLPQHVSRTPEPMACAAAQPSTPPAAAEPTWLQQLKVDAQNRHAADVYSGMWAEMQLRKSLKNILKKAEEVKLANPELQSASEPRMKTLPTTIAERPTPEPLPKHLTDEEMTRYLDLLQKNDEWVRSDVPIQAQRDKWESAARKKDPEYLRYVMVQLAERL